MAVGQTFLSARKWQARMPAHEASFKNSDALEPMAVAALPRQQLHWSRAANDALRSIPKPKASRSKEQQSIRHALHRRSPFGRLRCPLRPFAQTPRQSMPVLLDDSTHRSPRRFDRPVPTASRQNQVWPNSVWTSTGSIVGRCRLLISQAPPKLSRLRPACDCRSPIVQRFEARAPLPETTMVRRRVDLNQHRAAGLTSAGQVALP